MAVQRSTTLQFKLKCHSEIKSAERSRIGKRALEGYLEKSLTLGTSQVMQIPKRLEAGIQKKATSIKQNRIFKSHA